MADTGILGQILAQVIAAKDSVVTNAKSLSSDPAQHILKSIKNYTDTFQSQVDAAYKGKPEELMNQFMPAGIGAVGSVVGKKLTPAEAKYFHEVTGNKYDLEELLSSVPSAKIKGGKLTIDSEHLDNLSNYLDDSLRLREGEKLPPSFYSGDIIKKLLEQSQ